MYPAQKDVNELSDDLKSVMREYIKPYREIVRYWRKRIREKTGIDDPGYIELLAETKTRSSLSMIDGSISEINPEYQISYVAARAKMPGNRPFAGYENSLTKAGLESSLSYAIWKGLDSSRKVFGFLLKKLKEGSVPIYIEDIPEVRKPVENISPYSKNFILPDKKEMIEVANDIANTVRDVDKEIGIRMELYSERVRSIRLDSLSKEISLYDEAYTGIRLKIFKPHTNFGFFDMIKTWITRGSYEILEKDMDQILDDTRMLAEKLKWYVENVRSESIPTPGSYYVITKPYASDTLMHEAFGHTLEAINSVPNLTLAGLFDVEDFPVAMNIREHYLKKVFPNEPFEDVRFYDDPTMKKFPQYKHIVNAASYEMDYRGVKPKRGGTKLIENNTIVGLLTDIMSASMLYKMGIIDEVKLTGNERVSDIEKIPVSRMSTITIKKKRGRSLPSYEELFEIANDKEVYVIDGGRGGSIDLTELFGGGDITEVYRYDRNKKELIPLAWSSRQKSYDQSRLTLTISYNSIADGLIQIADPKEAEPSMGYCGHPLAGIIPVTGYFPPMLLKNIQMVVRTS